MLIGTYKYLNILNKYPNSDIQTSTLMNNTLVPVSHGFKPGPFDRVVKVATTPRGGPCQYVYYHIPRRHRDHHHHYYQQYYHHHPHLKPNPSVELSNFMGTVFVISMYLNIYNTRQLEWQKEA